MVNVSSKKRRLHTNFHSDGQLPKEYQVEAIIDKRVRRRKVEYLLKWKDYPHSENTWEEESHLNCPDLMKAFEDKRKQKKDRKRSSSKLQSKSPKQSKTTVKRKSKGSSSEETDGPEYQSGEDGSDTMEIDSDLSASEKNRGDGDRRMTRQSLQKPTASSSRRRKSSRQIVNQTNSRITSMTKTDSSNDDDADAPAERESSSTKRSRKNNSPSNPTPVITLDDDNNNNNNSIELSDKTSSNNETNLNESGSTNLRLHITPNSASSISFTPNNEDQDAADVPDETHLVEKIEAVKNDRDGLTFRIKLIDQDEPQWISSKIANRKYPQAIIAFWENHVEFT